METLTKDEKDGRIVDYLDELTAKGLGRRKAINEVCEKFCILHPQTVYNTERRVRAREWEEKHGEPKA